MHNTLSNTSKVSFILALAIEGEVVKVKVDLLKILSTKLRNSPFFDSSST